MGCDFHIQVQVLYGSTWVTIIEFETKSRCGGWPLTAAIHKVKGDHGVDGNHGRHQKSLFFHSYHADKEHRSRIDKIRFHASNKNPTVELPAKRTKIEDEDEDYWSWEKRCGVYYSRQEFLLYTSSVRELESRMLRTVDPEYNGGIMLYTLCLEPVATWCELALAAGPTRALSDIWMGHEKKFIDKVTEDLRKAQVALCKAHNLFMSQFKSKFPLPGTSSLTPLNAIVGTLSSSRLALIAKPRTHLPRLS